MNKQTQARLVTFARVLIGFLFFQHGAQKLFGWFTDNAAQELFSLMGLAGVIEFAVGVALMLGFYRRYASLLGIAQMVAAYGMAHLKSPWVPIQTGGELALLYIGAFILLYFTPTLGELKN